MSSSTSSESKKGDSRKLILGILTFALLATWGFIIFDKMGTKETIAVKDKQIVTVSNEKDSIQLAFNNASARLDSLTGINIGLKSELTSKTDDLKKKQAEIASILHKTNSTKEELKRATLLIEDLNKEINNYKAEIETLKNQNKELATTNQKLTTERDSLLSDKNALQKNLSSLDEVKRNVENLASTLHVSNVNILSIDKASDGKEKESSKVTKADLLRIKFDIDPNVLSPTGIKDIYLAVLSPEKGRVIDSSGSVDIRDEGKKGYTTLLKVDYQQGKKASVSYDLKKGSKDFLVGEYKVVIYNNGFNIGHGSKNLRKSGFLGL